MLSVNVCLVELERRRAYYIPGAVDFDMARVIGRAAYVYMCTLTYSSLTAIYDYNGYFYTISFK